MGAMVSVPRLSSTSVAGSCAGHTGKPGPFGEPVRAKLAQYLAMVLLRAFSAAVKLNPTSEAELKMNGSSAPWHTAS